MRDYIEKIIFPYVEEKRSELKLGNDQPSLLIFDNFKAKSCLTWNSHFV